MSSCKNKTQAEMNSAEDLKHFQAAETVVQPTFTVPDPSAEDLKHFQAAKNVVQQFYNDLDTADCNEEAIVDAFNRHVSPGYHWRGMHPFYEIESVQELAKNFWAPLKSSIKSIQRREDIFMAGNNFCHDGSEAGSTVWTVSMGHLMGIFQNDWLGIPSTKKMVFLRYAEFTQVSKADQKILQTAMHFDIPAIMIQAGVNLFPLQRGTFLVQPGPMTHTGLMMEPQDPAETQKTLDVINDMINHCTAYDEQHKLSLEDELAINWHKDMIWWGPSGIGASYTIPGYARSHSRPFRAAFTDREFGGHVCRLSEGEYGGFFGWPNLILTPTGGFLGLGTNTGKPVEMRVVDIYRRHGDKLAENWVFIDLLHFWKQQGLDILERMSQVNAQMMM